MSGLLLVPDSILRSLGVGAMTVGVVAMLAALTLVPALLGLLGDRVNALRVPYLGRAVDSAGREGRFWSRIARAVMRRPVISLVASAALLLAAAVPVLDLKLSEPGIRSFPDDAPSRLGFAALEEEFGIGTVDTVIVAVEADGEDPAVRTAVRELATELDSSPSFRDAEIEVAPDRMLAVVEAFVVGDTRDTEPQAVSGSGTRRSRALRRRRGDGLCDGETAKVIDYNDLMDTWLPRIILFGLSLSFVLLTVAFRSIVLA